MRAWEVDALTRCVVMNAVLIIVLTAVVTLLLERVAPAGWHFWRNRRRERRAADDQAEMRRNDQAMWDRRYGHLYGNRYVVAVDGHECEVELVSVSSDYDQVVLRRVDGGEFGTADMRGMSISQLDPEAYQAVERRQARPVVVRKVDPAGPGEDLRDGEDLGAVVRGLRHQRDVPEEHLVDPPP